MPLVSRIAIRMAFGWLIVGFGTGTALAAARGGFLPAAIYAAFELHTGALLIGFFVQLVIGVAFWMFPKHGSGAARGNEQVVVAGIVLLNLALVARVAASVAASSRGATTAGAGIALAVAICATQLWPRVKPFAEPKRTRSA